MTDKPSRFAHFDTPAGRKAVGDLRRSRMSGEEVTDENWAGAFVSAGVSVKSRDQADDDRRAQLIGRDVRHPNPRT